MRRTGSAGWPAASSPTSGADVIKLEPAGSDRSRPEWRAFNVNKRVLELDLREGPGAARGNCCATADICLLTPGSSAIRSRSGRVARRYPHLVVVAIRPFGGIGPRTDGKRATSS